MKALLEEGHTLHKPLLTALVQRFAEFAHGVGMDKHNEYLLPIFTFVQKCCGNTEAGLHQLVKLHKIEKIIYAPRTKQSRRPPTPLTNAIVAM